MNRQRRQFLLCAAAASAALSCRRPLRAAEPVAPPGAAPPPASAMPAQPQIALAAHAVAQDGQTGAGGPLSYFRPGQGPTFRFKKDAEIKVNLANDLSEATSLDWHGMRLPDGLGIMPGLNAAGLAPHASVDLILRPSDPGTYWFHPGMVAGIGDQTGRGLAGVLIIEEPDAPVVDHDMALLLTETPSSFEASQPLGATEPGPKAILVNGTAHPEMEPFRPGARLRLRIINASTRRALAVGFQGARPLVAAIDGQPSELFAPLNNVVPVGPGARFDIMVDLPRTAAAEFKVLLRRPESAPAGTDQPIFLARTEGAPRTGLDQIKALPPNPSLPRYIPLERSTRASLAVERRPGPHPATKTSSWTVNGIPGMELRKKPLFSAKRNTPVTLTFHNTTAELIALRLHGHVMRLLHAMDDGWEPYWRDSVLVPPGATHHAAFMADNPGKWLIDSPFFEQATGGLRTWFEVL